jgi:stringent starvation protein B
MRYDTGMSVSALTPSPNSTRPYLIRALYEWCVDNGYTPYIAAYVDASVQVPREHVKNNEIVLNVSMDATSSLKLGNEFIEFKARFSGSAREIMVPIDRVIAIYARENGQGMAFPVPQSVQARGDVTEPEPKMQSVAKKNPLVMVDSAAAELEESNAQPDANAQPSSRVMQLVSAATDSPPVSEQDVGDDAPPEPPVPPPSGPRPSLKRVK